MQPRHYREREQGDRSTDADKLSLFLRNSQTYRDVLSKSLTSTSHGVSGREIVTGMQKLRRTTTSIYAAGSLCKEVHKCHQKTTHQFRL
ncbi:unnamed protein product [Allacma fusca]|uniref:Uncharacterized protein n=1 Tax=Allacma fusca TaxID=39272 RepID=A0A8J2MCX7_9HEXA|nr:unnamed protein product [Allacma fusca]